MRIKCTGFESYAIELVKLTIELISCVLGFLNFSVPKMLKPTQ